MTDRTPQTETLRGELTDYREFGGHWCIANVKVKGAGMVKATGKVLGCEIGDTVEMTGRWVEDPKYGRQFKLRRIVRLTPEGSAGAVKWIASRCPNVGEARARKMVEHFGSKLWETIENNPLELCMIDGITHQRAGDIAAAYDKHRGERDAMITLRDWQLTDHQISQCVEQWGALDVVIRKLRENPYLLCGVDGFGFVRADKVARAMGVSPTSPARIAAGVQHVLSEGRQAGHCFVGHAALRNMAADLLGVERGLVSEAIRKASDSGSVICEASGDKGFRVYSAPMHRAEVMVAVRVQKLLSAGETAARQGVA